MPLPPSDRRPLSREVGPDDIPDLVERGWGEAVVVSDDPPIRALFYPDGTVRLEHHCMRPRDGLTLKVAPRLQLDAGHTIVQRDPLTVDPSCGCSDCGLHGWVRDGTWMPA